MEKVDETEADPRQAPTRLLEPGIQLGKYRLARLLGEGGMGQVWAARDPDLDRDVALKLLRVEQAAPQLRARLLREARAMARLKHPNVLTVYEVDSEGDRDYIAMELVDGMNLDQWLATSPPAKDVWDALIAAGRGLAAAHQAGLVHRDFKPHNVLRSNDGRVLVTDFGLARGVSDDVSRAPAVPREQIAVAITLDAPSKDTALDSSLTQTGALIGTPAYMAPEQYAGSPPDPRTDQFAFCVTAWQALAGKRPFEGTTLDELRRQSARGVKDVKVKLPGGVRAALVRGLDPDPKQRWDSLEDLLAALERRGDKRRRLRATWTAAGLFLFAVYVLRLVFPQHSTKTEPSPYACQPPEQAFADAWTPERRAALENRAGASATLVMRALDDLRHAWITSYAAACAAPPSQATFAKLGCLLGERDEVSAFARLAETLPVPTFDRLDPWGELPRVDACASDSPIAPPRLPEDRKQRDKIIALRAEIAALRLREPQNLVDRADELARAASALGWAPLVPELDQAVGQAAQFLGHDDVARAHLTAAAGRAAQLRDYRLEATARIALLATENDETADPTDPQREERLTQDARDAVHRAGDDPELADTIDVLGATARISRGDFAGAEQLLKKDTWGASVGTRAAVEQTLQRMRLALRQGQYAEAYSLGQLHESMEPQAGPAHTEIERMMIQATWGMGKLDEMHERVDKVSDSSRSHNTRWLSGKVTDAHGKPVAHVHVVAWSGTLTGDGHRLFRRKDFEGEDKTTDSDGDFTIPSAPVHGGIMAEQDDLRSVPVEVPDKGEVTLVLRPTHGIGGKVTTPAPRPPLDALVTFSLGQASWVDQAPVQSDGTFRISGLPDGGGFVGLTPPLSENFHWDNLGPAHDGLALVWPGTATIDVTVPHARAIVVMRGHDKRAHVDPKNPSTIWLEGAHKDYATKLTGSIGFATMTPEGSKLYAKGDVHAVLSDIAPGPISVCAQDSISVTCVDADAPAAGTVAVAVRPTEK
jgi:hypothetical protein